MAEDEQWLAIRKEAGLKIDPETAQVAQDWGDKSDPYSVYDEWELPEDFRCYGRLYWARSPEATSGFTSAICPMMSKKRFGQTSLPD